MTILSARHSFVNFNGEITDFVVPAYNSLAVAFQFLVDIDDEIPVTDVIMVKIASESNSIIYAHTSLYAKDICYWGRITGIDWDNDFPITIDTAQPIPEGVYSKEELFETIRLNLSLNAYDKDFLQCCDAIDRVIESSAGTININFYKALQQVEIAENANTLFSAAGVALDACFRYALIHSSGNNYSNLFKRVPSTSYLTKVIYSGNEDQYGFYYPGDTVFNQVLLPLYLRFPKFPENRKVYKKSSGQFKVLSASIEKEWEMITENMPASFHERIAVLLAHDNISFNGTSVTKKDDYNIDWQELVEVAQAKCKMLTAFEGRNSNCEKRPTCTTPIVPTEPNFCPDVTVGTVTSSSVHLSWPAVPGATKYAIKPFDNPDGNEPPYFSEQETTATSVTFSSGISSGNTYYFRVLAYVDGAYVNDCPDLTEVTTP